jgi:tetratricopeptide (TPR) repeat protein
MRLRFNAHIVSPHLQRLPAVVALIVLLLLLAEQGCSSNGNSSSTPVPTVPSSQLIQGDSSAATAEDLPSQAASERIVLPQVMEILEQAQLASPNIEDVSDRAQLLAAIAAALAKNGNEATAADWFRTAIDLANTVPDAEGSDDGAKAYTLAEIAQRQAEAGAFGEAVKLAAALGVFQGTYNDQHQPTAYAMIAYHQAKSGDILGAIDTANLLHDDYWKAFALAQVAGVQARAEGLSLAKPTFLQATAAARLVKSSLRAHALAGVARELV